MVAVKRSSIDHSIVEMTQSDLAIFQKMVLDDPDLQADLRSLQDEAAFSQAVVIAAGQRGLVVQLEDVQAALNAARRTWIERWIL